MKKISFIIIIIFFTCNLHSQSSIDWTKIHYTSIEGIDELYNLNFKNAEKIFNEIIQVAPTDPRGYFFNCILYYFKFSLERNRVDFDQFFLYSLKVIEVCENLIEYNKNDYMSKFYLAGIYGYRGLMYQFDNSIIKAIWDGKKGFSMLKDIVKEKPDTYDAYLGTGLFDYLLAKIPKGYAWILGILGYKGDKERGIQQLKIAEEKGIYTKSEAAFYLSQFLYFEHRYDEAFFFIKKLMKKYPDNTLFLVLYANMEMKVDKPEYALSACQKAIEINHKKNINTADEYVFLIYANTLFLTGNYKKAAGNYEIYISKVTNKDLISNLSYYRMGLSYDFSGSRQDAIRGYKLARKLNKDERQYDDYIYDLCQDKIKNKPSEEFLKITETNNKFSLKRYDECIPIYKMLLEKDNLISDEKMVCLYNLASCYEEKQQYNESLMFFDEALKVEPDVQKHLIPYIYMKRGRILVKLSRPVEAKVSFKKVFEFDKYHFQKSLEETVEEELEKIK